MAHESNCACFTLSLSDAVSKLFPNTKAVRNLFTLAAESTPCVIILEDIEVLCRNYREGDDQVCRRVKTELLVSMNSLPDGICVIASTNTPWLLDTAIRRR